MYSEVAWVLVSSGTQVRPQIILEPGYLPHYLFVSYHYDLTWSAGRQCQSLTVQRYFAPSSPQDQNG